MKRLFIIFVILSLLAGCTALPASIPFLGTPTQISSPQPTPSPFGLPATFTPDLFAINTAAPTTTPPTGTPAITNTPVPTFTPTNRPTITLEPLDVNLFTPSPNLFPSMQRSTSQLVWGSTCDGARSIQFVVQVVKARRLKFVTLWWHLQDKYSGRQTAWQGGAIMNDNDQGTYFYTLEVDQIADYRYYEDAWLVFQFAASTVTRKVLGRSVVDRTSVSLTHCKVFNP